MAVLIALLLPLLLGVAALGVDMSVFYYNWAQMHSAADAAVLAGASAPPGNPSQAISNATAYAQTNGIKTIEIVSTLVNNSNQAVTIQLSRNVPFYFGKMLGLMQSPIVVTATSTLECAGSAVNILPVGIDSQTTYSYGQTVTLMHGNGHGCGEHGLGPGNWGALALGGNGANNFSNNVTNGYSCRVHVGDCVDTEPGKMTGPVRSSFDNRIQCGASRYPSASCSNHTLDDPRAVTVPICDFTGANGKSSVAVKGFAVLWLLGVDDDLGIQATFIQQVSPGSTPSSAGCGYGAYEAVLTN
ncbi:MAG TPA: pilus assembly protein TadG-related protein [Candidatus Binataceae bacterium]|nr:pilus assembly protein TadG-related protein [Candidatus Binataceae bacterium]